MAPLNTLMNYSAELTQTSSFFPKKVQSRLVMAAAIPIELIASLENLIKLPFQTVGLTLKIPAKVLNVMINSTTLKDFETKLSGPQDVMKTALKIVGYALGSLFTLAFGIIYPYKNFSIHCTLSLITNQKDEKNLRLAEENRKKEIASHEKTLEERLNHIINAIRQRTKTSAPLKELPEQQKPEDFHEPEIHQLCEPEQEIKPSQVTDELKEAESDPLRQKETQLVQETETPLQTDPAPIEETIQVPIFKEAKEEKTESSSENSPEITEALLEPIEIHNDDPLIPNIEGEELTKIS